jgi:hypothetical protein
LTDLVFLYCPPPLSPFTFPPPPSILPPNIQDVEEALALLNAMGTCDSPPDAEADMDWTFRAAMLYVFYVCRYM